jgi:histidine triad (HIT) family protein
VEDCIFCAIVEGRSPSFPVYEDEHALAFMDINPATDGHTLVVPRRHVRDLWDIGEEDLRWVMAAAHRVAHRIKAALSPDGMNVIHASGWAAFQTVFHFHLHLVPRYKGDPIKLPWVPRPGDRTKISAMANNIRSVGGRTSGPASG